MQIKRERPIEIPTQKELLNRPIKHENFEVKKFNDETLEKVYERLRINSKFDVAEKKPEILPKVSLSWEKDIESVVDWMENHMEAFNETHDWFLVDFINDDWSKWFIVLPDDYDRFEVDDTLEQIEINWVLYNIFEYTISKDEHKMYELLDELEKKTNLKDIYKLNSKKNTEKFAREILDNFLKLDNLLWNDNDKLYKKH